MTASVSFAFEHSPENVSPKIYVPPSGVGEDAGGRYVYVIEPQGNDIGIARKRIIKIGDLNELGFEAVSGIREGELIATAGLQVLLDGMKVRLDENGY